MHANNKSGLMDAEKISVLIDSVSFAALIGNNREASALLAYQNSDFLEMIRTPLDVQNTLLQAIPQYTLKKAPDGTDFIEETIKNGSSRQLFGYREEDILIVAQEIYGTKKVDKDQLEGVTMVFIQACFNSRMSRPSILVTENETILRNRLWFESHFPGGSLNIMSASESSLFIDLFFKSKGKYYCSGRTSFNKGHWYWLSMRTKLPHYHVNVGANNKIINSLANRVQFTLMAIDEIGIQYYKGVDNDVMSNTEYHFNYLISLLTGIFDNLAIKTNELYNLNLKPPFKISLSRAAGKDLLKEVIKNNQKLATLIENNANLIEIVYSVREIVIHRESLGKCTFQFRSDDSRWEANMLEIPKETHKHILVYENIRSGNLKSLTKWGIYNQDDGIFISPYFFSLELVKAILVFADEYLLLLLGEKSFVENEKQKKSAFGLDLERFEQYHLGF